MKTFNLGLMISALILTALLLNLNSCKKQQQNQTSDVISIDDESHNIMNHILDFKEEMEYYRNNPGLKTDYKKEIMQTISDWEASMNTSFCHSYIDVTNTESFDTVIDIPLVGPDSIFMSDVADKYYNEIIQIVKQRFIGNQFLYKKLMVVDLEPINDGDSLWINAIIGNNQTISSTPKDWYWGDYQGVCYTHENQGSLDAAIIIAQNTRNYFYEAPPEGTSWYFLDVEDHIIDNPLGYRNNDDDLDNYKDYKLYYANKYVVPYNDDVKCLEHYDELAYYKQNYIDFTLTWLSMSGGKKFKECVYKGWDFEDVQEKNSIYHTIEHTKLGFRYHTEINIPSDDILTY